MFLAMGTIFPFFTGQVPQIGSMLLPMHIPVFLCAFICGWRYSVPMAVILPLFRSVVFGRPNLYPEAISIAFELGTYALVIGLLYGRVRKQNVWTVYGCMIAAMVIGRVVRGAVQLSLLGLKGMPYTFELFFAGVVMVAIPGIILQLLLIPQTLLLLDKIGLVPFRNRKVA